MSSFLNNSINIGDAILVTAPRGKFVLDTNSSQASIGIAAGSGITPIMSMLKTTLFESSNNFHLIYFDAFGARVQPELWTEQIFKKMYIALKKGGVLVTYSAKGSVRRAMQTVGFVVERLPGPPGKREMLRARKT